MTEQNGPGRRKLIETALPLEVVSGHAAREKSIRRGHPSTLHLWWSRKPLAAARAVLFAQLVDDPSADPQRFPTPSDQDAERERLLALVGRLAAWDATTDPALMAEVRREVARAVDRCGGEVAAWDPFAGGGSIPLEAQRLGLPVVAGDLNPVAVLLERALLELPRRWRDRPAVGAPTAPATPDGRAVAGAAAEPGDAAGDATPQPVAGDRDPRPDAGPVVPAAAGLAADLRFFGEQVLRTARSRLAPLYPPVHWAGGTHEVAAYLWVRTVPCGNPACTATVPMLSNPWLRRGGRRPAWLEPTWDGTALRFRVVEDGEAVDRVGRGAVFTCVACGTPTTADDVKGRAREGGLGRVLRCVVPDAGPGRPFLVLDEREVCPPVPDPSVSAAAVADPADPAPAGAPSPAGLADEHDGRDPDGFPDPSGLEVELDPAVTNAPTYGVPTVADLHLPRQRRALEVFAAAVAGITPQVRACALAAGLPPEQAEDYARDVTVLLGLVLGRLSNRMSTACIWNAHRGLVEQTFIQNNAIAFPWDFAEANPLSGGSGSWTTQLELVARVIERCDPAAEAVVLQQDARTAPAQLAGRQVVISTDPPYFDYFLYSSLSDYFYVWLRRALRDVVPELFATIATPRGAEIVARRADGEGGARRFLDGLTAAMRTLAATASPHFPVTVYYAYRSTRVAGVGPSAWEAFLGAVCAAGLTVTATWPIRTERTEGVKTGRNSLASSIVVVCRKRPADAPTADRRQFLTRLRGQIPAAVTRLQAAGVSPVDLAQAVIGPGMAVYTGYAEVTDVDGHPMPVGVALELVNQVLDETLAQQESDLDAQSRFCLAWFEQYGFGPGPFGGADGLATAKGARIVDLQRRGLLRAGAGKVQLVPPDELGEAYRLPPEGPIPVWELVIRLTRQLHEHGTGAAAALLADATGRVDPTACRELAYALYDLCRRHGWTASGVQFAALGTAWPDLVDHSWPDLGAIADRFGRGPGVGR